MPIRMQEGEAAQSVRGHEGFYQRMSLKPLGAVLCGKTG